MPPTGPADDSQPRFSPEAIRAYEEEEARRRADERRVVALVLPILERHYLEAGIVPRPDFRAARSWIDVCTQFDRLAEALQNEPSQDEALRRLAAELTEFSLANPDHLAPDYRLAMLLRGWVWYLTPEQRARWLPAAAGPAVDRIDEWIKDQEYGNPQSYY